MLITLATLNYDILKTYKNAKTKDQCMAYRAATKSFNTYWEDNFKQVEYLGEYINLTHILAKNTYTAENDFKVREKARVEKQNEDLKLLQAQNVRIFAASVALASAMLHPILGPQGVPKLQVHAQTELGKMAASAFDERLDKLHEQSSMKSTLSIFEAATILEELVRQV